MASEGRAPILVTGAAGFVGARFVRSCAERGIPVISVDRSSHFETRPELLGIPFGPIVDRDSLFDWLAREKPRLRGVAHMGACSVTTQLDSAFMMRVNYEYSRDLWRWCAAEGVPMVYASSAATYGDGSLGYDDDEARMAELKPLNPYGESKLRFDLFALEADRRGEKPPSWAGFKFFNVYGFPERHKTLTGMASVVLQAHDQIRSTGGARLFKSHRDGIAHGEQKRDFVFVDDVVDVLNFALEKPIPRGIFNLGSGRARTFLDLARAVFRAMGRPEKIEFIDMPPALRERYQYFTEARMEKLRRAGYSRPFTSLEEGVARYVAELASP